jgi:hypothetical protein
MNQSVLEKISIPQVENHYNLTSTSAQYPAPQHGGRVPNINDPATFQFAARPYKLYADGRPVLGDDPRRDLVGSMHKETPLNAVFFSLANIDGLQQAIHDQVYSMSGGQYDIGRQSEDDLRIVMRSYYLMFARNDASNVSGELEELNRRVIGYCAGKIYSEVDFHMFYRKDLEEFAPAIANPVNVKSYGTHRGELKSFF